MERRRGLTVRYRNRQSKKWCMVYGRRRSQNFFLICQIFSESNFSISLITILITLMQESPTNSRSVLCLFLQSICPKILGVLVNPLQLIQLILHYAYSNSKVFIVFSNNDFYDGFTLLFLWLGRYCKKDLFFTIQFFLLHVLCEC